MNRRWIGKWIIGVAILHTVFGLVSFGRFLKPVIQRGVFNAIGGDVPAAFAVWFLLFGAALLIAGMAIAMLENALAQPLPKSLGWSLLLLAIVGIVLMPASGFWLIFPPALAVLLAKAKTA